MRTKTQARIRRANEKISESTDGFETLSVDIGDLHKRLDIGKLCLIDADTPAGIVDAMASLPSLYARHAHLREKLEDYCAALRHDYEVWYAGVYDVICKDSPKTTEKAKEQMVRIRYSDEYDEWQAKIRSTEGARNRIAKVVLRSLEMKASMLQSIGAMIRVEKDVHGMTGAITSKRTGGDLSKL